MIRVQRLKVIIVYSLVFLIILSVISGCEDKPKEPDKLIIYYYNMLIRIASDKEKEKAVRKTEILEYWDSVKEEVQSAVNELQQNAGNTENIETNQKLEKVFDKLRELSTVLSDEGISLENVKAD